MNGAARAPLRWLRRVSPGSLADRVLANLDHMRAHRSADLSDCPPGAYSIKVGSGCRGECAYCAVKNSRGAIKSAAPDEVLGSFRDGLARGYADFVLLGTDQGSYGADIGTDLIALLRALVAEAGDYSIRIRNLEPMGLIEMFPRLREILACGRISLISTPVQSGSDRVLKRMKRPYSVQEIAACVRAIRRDHPQVRLRTQVMVGFPGETGEDFRATLAMLDDLRFDYVEVYRFSPRPNTEAAAMPDQVPERVKGRRHRAMLAKVMLRQLTARAAGGARNARHPRGVLAVD